MAPRLEVVAAFASRNLARATRMALDECGYTRFPEGVYVEVATVSPNAIGDQPGPRNRSPLINPSDSAYAAPSEKPPMAGRAGSTATILMTGSSARFANSTSSPNSSRPDPGRLRVYLL